jgi:hypothetical protein
VNVFYYKELGRYDFASNKKDWRVKLVTPFGNFSQTWSEDDEPEIDDLLPSEVLDLLEKRLKSWWISTGREADLARIAAIREHRREIDIAWLERQIESAEKRAASLRLRAVEIRDELADESESEHAA